MAHALVRKKWPYIGQALLAVVLWGLVFILSGCGYSFRGSGSVLPPDVRRIAVPLVENSSPEAGLTLILTEALRDEFERYGAVSIVEDASDADAILKARIVDVRRQTSSVTSKTDTALQFDTTLVMAAELRRVTGGLLWQDRAITVSRPFGATSGVVVTSSAQFSESALGAGDLAGLDSREISRGQEQETLALLAEDVARTVYEKAVAPDF